MTHTAQSLLDLAAGAVATSHLGATAPLAMTGSMARSTLTGQATFDDGVTVSISAPGMGVMEVLTLVAHALNGAPAESPAAADEEQDEPDPVEVDRLAETESDGPEPVVADIAAADDF